MKWEPAECRRGDIVRIRVGSIYHYGIFVSDDEVIQFGLPPRGIKRAANDEIRVLATSVTDFAQGAVIEVGVCEKTEAKGRRSGDETVAAARARMGSGGYNLLHNNCEHFVNECAFGRRFSEQEELAKKKWKERRVLDVYLSVIPEDLLLSPVLPPVRQREIDACSNARVKQEKMWAWKTLEYGLMRSFSLSLEHLTVEKDRFGAWRCPDVFFSLSHSGRLVAAAVSNKPVGVDMEELAVFEKTVRNGFASPEAFLKKICSREELSALRDSSTSTLALLWTQKESAFKKEGTGRFKPSKVSVKDTLTSFGSLAGQDYCLSVCGDVGGQARTLIYDPSGQKE